MVTKNESTAPNTGVMLRALYKKRKINRAALARKMNLHRSTVVNYDERSSLQVRVLWNLAVALGHNFFADIAAQLPPTYATNLPEDSTQAQRIAQLEEENKMLNAKVETLMAVIRK